MSKQKNKSDFNAMNVPELKNICRNVEFRYLYKASILKTSLMEIASPVERMALPVDPNFGKDQTNDAYFNNS